MTALARCIAALESIEWGRPEESACPRCAAPMALRRHTRNCAIGNALTEARITEAHIGDVRHAVWRLVNVAHDVASTLAARRMVARPACALDTRRLLAPSLVDDATLEYGLLDALFEVNRLISPLPADTAPGGIEGTPVPTEAETPKGAPS